jgi:hypothetical protein
MDGVEAEEDWTLLSVTRHSELRVRQPRTGTATRSGVEQAQSMGDWPGPGHQWSVSCLHARMHGSFSSSLLLLELHWSTPSVPLKVSLKKRAPLTNTFSGRHFQCDGGSTQQ